MLLQIRPVIRNHVSWWPEAGSQRCPQPEIDEAKLHRLAAHLVPLGQILDGCLVRKLRLLAAALLDVREQQLLGHEQRNGKAVCRDFLPVDR
jgi:hypothetical protein